MHDIRYRKLQAFAENSMWVQHWGCAQIYLAGVKDIQDRCCCPEGKVPRQASKHKGGARLLVSPTGGTALTLHITSTFSLLVWAYRYQTADIPAALSAGVITLLLGTWNRVALFRVWTPMWLPWKIRPCLSADFLSVGTDLYRAAEHFTWALSPLALLSLETDHNVQYPTCTDWWQRKEPLQQQPWERWMNISYLVYRRAHLRATVNASSSHSLSVRSAPILAAFISNLVAQH